MHTYIHTHIYIHAYIHTYIHTYKHTYIHTYTEWWFSMRDSHYKVTWSFDHAALRDHVTNQHYQVSTKTVPIDTKFGRVLTNFVRLPLLKPPYDFLIKWITWGHVKISTISTFTKLIVTRLDRVLTSRRRFSSQTLKSSPIFLCF